MRCCGLSGVLFALVVAPVWGANVEAPGVPNFHEVDQHVFRGGQPVNAGWNSLAHLGIKLVIDLRPPSEHQVKAEERAVEAAGMKYINVPMRGLHAPLGDEVSKVLALMVSDSDGPVFVHCRRGSDRTGTVVACYRILHDRWENQRALREARSYGMARIERGMMHYIEHFNPATLPLATNTWAAPAATH